MAVCSGVSFNLEERPESEENISGLIPKSPSCKINTGYIVKGLSKVKRVDS